jgi:GMP synthase (glutamine-hydrolysing)
MQELAYRISPDNVIAGKHREYGHAMLKAQSVGGHVDRLFDGIEESMRVWMSHGDKLAKLPQDFHTVATSDNSEYAAIAHGSKPIYGLQFHPEVTHTQNGTTLLKNFAVGICGCKQDWTMEKFLEEQIAQIRRTVGEKGQVLAAVSGGVDSTVAAKLMVRHFKRICCIRD